eukprot:6456926-Amphidinium_carterae.1
MQSRSMAQQHNDQKATCTTTNSYASAGNLDLLRQGFVFMSRQQRPGQRTVGSCPEVATRPCRKLDDEHNDSACKFKHCARNRDGR